MNHKNTYYYKAISKKYQEKFSTRGETPYIQHIDEGIEILEFFKVDSSVIEAFCLHPLFQANDDLINSLSNKHLMSLIDKKVLTYLMEYRKTANFYSSRSKEVTEPRLSPIVEVNHMLLADKLQNYKDFLENQSIICPVLLTGTLDESRYQWLDQYFQKWLLALAEYFQLDFKGLIEEIWKQINGEKQ